MFLLPVFFVLVLLLVIVLVLDRSPAKIDSEHGEEHECERAREFLRKRVLVSPR